MSSKTFTLTAPILHCPIEDTDRMWYVKITDDSTGKQFAEFYLALTERKPDFYCPLYLDALAGRTVTLSCEDENVPDTLFDGIISGGQIEDRQELYPELYREPGRQRIHFSSRRGWLNDPNGLVYVNGEFRMCYQHNPYGPNHGGINVSWGLAVSTDGVHFREYPDAIRPSDAQTHIASGSAIVDRDGLAGFGKGTILAAYTALQSWMFKNRQQTAGNRGQMLEYSTDGGFTFHKFPKEPIIPVPANESWRDPKLLFTEEGKLCIAVYETFEGKNCVSFYSSENCTDWKFESRSPDLFECPDLFPLPVAGAEEQLWVLYGADGRYLVGEFRDYRFTPHGGGGYLDYGQAVYAGQTWNSHPDGTVRYHIAWMIDGGHTFAYDREKNHGEPFAQSMSLVCRLELHKAGGSYRLFRTPIDNIAKLRFDAANFDAAEEPTELFVPGDCVFTIGTDTDFTVSVGENGFDYDKASGQLTFTGGKTYSPHGGSELKVRIITDVRSVEFFVADEVSATFTDPAEKKMLRVNGARASGTKWRMHGIWE